MFRPCGLAFLLLVIALLVGCKKKSPEESTHSADSPIPRRSGESSANPFIPVVDPVTKPEDKDIAVPEPETKVEGKFAGMKEWSRIGDVQVQIISAKLMKVPLKTLSGTEYLSREKELVLAMKIQNLSKVKKLDYHRWRSQLFDSVTDEHGNKYRIHDYDNIIDAESHKTIQPEGPVHIDFLCVEPPVAPATELKVILPSLVSSQKEQYRFKIPASVWKETKK